MEGFGHKRFAQARKGGADGVTVDGLVRVARRLSSLSRSANVSNANNARNVTATGSNNNNNANNANYYAPDSSFGIQSPDVSNRDGESQC